MNDLIDGLWAITTRQEAQEYVNRYSAVNGLDFNAAVTDLLYVAGYASEGERKRIVALLPERITT
jgi:DNA-directed RNA polymerase subunit F